MSEPRKTSFVKAAIWTVAVALIMTTLSILVVHWMPPVSCRGSVEDKSPSLEPNAPFLFIKFFICQGLIEEAVFRGLIFCRLRIGRSFKSAALLSAVLFSIVHLANFTRGFSPGVLMAVVTSMVFAFILAFPLAAPFELGAGSIVGGAIWHTAIDSVNWFQHASEPGPSLLTYLLSLLAAVALVFLLPRREQHLTAAA